MQFYFRKIALDACNIYAMDGTLVAQVAPGFVSGTVLYALWSETRQEWWGFGREEGITAEAWASRFVSAETTDAK